MFKSEGKPGTVLCRIIHSFDIQGSNQTKFTKIRIEVNKTYGVPHWRNDLKRVLKRAGADCKQIVFLLNDQQIKDESFLEDISMVLNTGDVPNLFLPEEKADILERIQVTIDG